MLFRSLLKEISDEPTTSQVKLIPYNEISAGRKYQDVMRRVPDNTKAERILGIKAQTSLKEGLKITFDWQKKVTSKKLEVS
mgnify:CR=1 FL=1